MVLIFEQQMQHSYRGSSGSSPLSLSHIMEGKRVGSCLTLHSNTAMLFLWTTLYPGCVRIRVGSVEREKMKQIFSPTFPILLLPLFLHSFSILQIHWFKLDKFNLAFTHLSLPGKRDSLCCQDCLRPCRCICHCLVTEPHWSLRYRFYEWCTSRHPVCSGCL